MHTVSGFCVCHCLKSSRELKALEKVVRKYRISLSTISFIGGCLSVSKFLRSFHISPLCDLSVAFPLPEAMNQINQIVESIDRLSSRYNIYSEPNS